MSYLIYLYNEIPKADLNLERVLAYLGNYCSFAKIEVRGNFISHFFSTGLIRGLANSWNTDLSEERAIDQAEEKRFDYEQQAYLKPEAISSKIIYHGWQLLELLQSQIPKAETSQDQLHLFLTPRLLVTKAEDDRRYHARTLLGGQYRGVR